MIFRKKYTIESKLENPDRIEFRFSRNETKNKNQTYHQSICITFIISDKADNIYDNYYNNISNTEIKIDKEVYYSVHRKEDNNLNALYKKVEVKDKVYNIMISPYYGEDWQYETIDEIVLEYRELGIADFIENIIDTLSVNNKY
ncbi:hypothetical protein [Alkaliphilus sp. B6464]|uniref:hypothetical protein n=1 Tax=Alkaliphilus sp. B6464 TaxID=2731219 RepID=UPI001BAB0E25|nr:hypothetical protein [Alkaliphilus sp. B6464]QUH19809.1 hypothetical protein HYG84_07755 [Alkaliphilus sp. B6464]